MSLKISNGFFFALLAIGFVAAVQQARAESALGLDAVTRILQDPQVKPHLADKLIEKISVRSDGAARSETHVIDLELRGVNLVPCRMKVTLESIHTLEGVDHVLNVGAGPVCQTKTSSPTRLKRSRP